MSFMCKEPDIFFKQDVKITTCQKRVSDMCHKTDVDGFYQTVDKLAPNTHGEYLII